MGRIRRFVKRWKWLRLFAKFVRNSYRLGKVLIGRDKYIKQLNIEMCSKCNARCRYCALSLTREQRYFDPDILEKLLNNILEYGYNLGRIHLTGGDGLQHPNLEGILSCIRRYKERGGKSCVLISTNVILLGKEKVELIVNSQVVDVMQCSIDGYDRKSFEWLRPPAKFDNIVKNMEYLLKLEGRPVVNIWNGNLSSRKPYADYFQDLLDKADGVDTYVYHDWGGQLEDSINIKIPKGFCYMSFEHVYIMADGKVGKCCWDLNGKTVYGDLNENTFKEIQTSRRRKFDLLNMLFHRRYKVKGCADCTLGVD